MGGEGGKKEHRYSVMCETDNATIEHVSLEQVAVLSAVPVFVRGDM